MEGHGRWMNAFFKNLTYYELFIVHDAFQVTILFAGKFDYSLSS
jgi:hypothetical protein